MRSTMAVILALVLLGAPAMAAAPAKKKAEFSSTEHILRWINGYRTKPDPGKLPAAVKAMSELGVFRDMDTAGIYVGFMAGVLQTNPKRAEELVGKMFPMPPEDQVAIVRAIAYSDLPDWKDLMLKFAERMPARKALIDRFVYGKQPTLKQMALDSGTGPARHAVGPLLRHRLLRADLAHGLDPDLGQGRQQRRAADHRQHGQAVAGHQRLARQGAARHAQGLDEQRGQGDAAWCCRR